jgi:imidazolonepropionase-like amidohydrolase
LRNSDAVARLSSTAAALLLACAAPAAAQSTLPPWAVTHATVIDGTGAAPLPDAVVAGAGERITCVGRPASCPIPSGASILDASGKWIVPGLIDTHVHLGADAGAAARAQLTRLAFGITTTREAGTPLSFEANLDRRRVAASPSVPEPRLIVSGLISDELLTRYAERDAGALVRRLAGLGADAIKVKQAFTPAELQSIVGNAHAVGLPVFGHTWGLKGSGLAPALDAGIDGLSHMTTFSEFGQRPDAERPPAPEGLAFWVWTKDQWHYQDEDRLSRAIARVADQHVWIEPMLVTEKHFTLPYPVADEVAYLGKVQSLEQLLRVSLPVGDTGWVKRARRRARIDAAYQRICGVVGRIHARGGIVLAATDDMLPGPGLLDEITLLTGCGLSAMAALQAATQRAAAALKLPETGTLEPGKIADLVIVGADPLSNPEHLKRTWRVMKGGYVHDPAALLAPTIESYQAELRKAWVARIAAALGVLAVLGGLLAGYRWRRSRWPPSA